MRVDGGDAGIRDESIVGPPRWVKVFGLAALVIVAAFIVMLTSGHRGPGRHLRSLDDAGAAPHADPMGQNEHRP